MTVIDLPESWDDLAAQSAAQALVIAHLEAELEAARKVADAAVAYDQAKTNYDVDEAYGRLGASVVEKMLTAHSEMRTAVREYRERVERQGRRCEYKFNEPEPPVSIGKPCDLGHDNPALRQDMEFRPLKTRLRSAPLGRRSGSAMPPAPSGDSQRGHRRKKVSGLGDDPVLIKV